MRFWAQFGGSFASGETRNIGIRPCYEDEKTRDADDGDVIAWSWEHATKSGDRDYRFKDNYKNFIVRIYGIELRFPGITIGIQISPLSKSKLKLAMASFAAILKQPDRYDENSAFGMNDDEDSDQSGDDEAGDTDFDDDNGNDRPSPSRPWYEILNVSPDATREVILAARNDLVRKCHPDRLHGLDAEFEQLANKKLTEINAAYEEAKKYWKTSAAS